MCSKATTEDKKEMKKRGDDSLVSLGFPSAAIRRGKPGIKETPGATNS